jgi:RNA polymerase sigma-70 factor (ECF subfamily)
MARLRSEETSAGRPERFDVLKPFLGADQASAYPEAAERLGLGEGAVRVAVHRLRRRFGEVVREEIARTVADPGDVESEIRWLLSAVRSRG